MGWLATGDGYKNKRKETISAMDSGFTLGTL